MLTQVTARLGHTHDQCAGTLGLAGMLHWHDDWRHKISLHSCVRVDGKWTRAAKAQARKGSFLWCESSGCQSGAFQSQKQMRTMARLCKCARRQGWVEPGSGMSFCWSVMPPFEGMHTWQLFALCRSRQLTPTPLLAHFFYNISFHSFFLFSFIFSSFPFFLHFILYFFYLFFGKTKPTPTLICMDLIVRCPPISPTLGSLYLMTQNQMCGVGSSFRFCSITKVPGC